MSVPEFYQTSFKKILKYKYFSVKFVKVLGTPIL